MLRRIWDRSYRDTAHRVRGILREIFGYACSIGALKHVDNFMRANDEIGRLGVYRKRPYATLLEPAQIGRLVRDLRAYHGRGLLVWSALNLAPLLAQRPGQLIAMRWEQVDLKQGLWTCPPSIMKQSTEAKEDPRTRPHLVPLPLQAVEILQGLRGYTGRHESGWVFPSFDRRSKGRHISENTLGKALRSMGYSTRDQITPHGFRSMMQSSCRDFLGIDFDTTDRQLAHKPRNMMGDTYDRSTLLDARELMVQRYADLLDRWADEEGPGAPHPRVELRVVEGVA